MIQANSMALVACYYNPCNFQRRLDNYFKFVEGLGEYSKLLYTVELAFGDQEFSLGSLDNLTQIRSDSLLWQKEALLNVGIRKVCSMDYDYVAWLDADIKFKNAGWYDNILSSLQTHSLVQVFEKLKRYNDESDFQVMKGTVASIGGTSPGTGFGWACSTSKFEDGFGLYDKCIVGGGDTLIYSAACEKLGDWLRKRPTTISHGEDICDWANGWYSRVYGDLGFAKNSIDTFYHGSLKNRNYLNRHELLLKEDYDPSADLCTKIDGTLEWTDRASSGLKVSLKDYFSSRVEDS